jgi:hypothetical protein
MTVGVESDIRTENLPNTSLVTATPACSNFVREGSRPS